MANHAEGDAEDYRTKQGKWTGRAYDPEVDPPEDAPANGVVKLREVLKGAGEAAAKGAESVTFKSMLATQLATDPALDVLRKRMDAKRTEMNDYMSLTNDIEGRINERNLKIQILQGENEEDERQRRAVQVLQQGARNEVTNLENAIQDFN